MESKVGGLVFSSSFDSGNLARAELVDEDGTHMEVNCFTSPDCAGTEFQSGNRSWFYFSVKGSLGPGRVLRINMHNMNKQNKLYSQGLEPIMRIDLNSSTPGTWGRYSKDIEYEVTDDDEFILSFSYQYSQQHTSESCVYFAFCYPFSYEDCQTMLRDLDQRYLILEGSKNIDEKESETESSIYYHRDLLVKSLDGLRVDLITISSRKGILTERESSLPHCFPEKHSQRSQKFDPSKKTFFLSARVHPGETPGTHVFNGFLKFILDPNDPRARVLRDLFVFKLVPILNPDGVKRGHYRTDSRGVNLNRCYNSPDPHVHPTIYAAKALCLYFNQQGSLMYYVDLHGHASKRGCFIYGNSLDGKRQIDNVLYPKLISLNSPYFDFEGCNFSEKNMFSKDKRDGLSKEGSGRVGIFFSTDLLHCYTLECNYNTGRTINILSPISGDDGKGEKHPVTGKIPMYGIEHFEDVGRGIAIAALDIKDVNPWSRLSTSEWGSLSGLKKWVAEHIRGNDKAKASTAATRGRIAVARRAHKSTSNMLDDLDDEDEDDEHSYKAPTSKSSKLPLPPSLSHRKKVVDNHHLSPRFKRSQTKDISSNLEHLNLSDKALSTSSSSSTLDQKKTLDASPIHRLPSSDNISLTSPTLDRPKQIRTSVKLASPTISISFTALSTSPGSVRELSAKNLKSQRTPHLLPVKGVTVAPRSPKVQRSGQEK